MNRNQYNLYINNVSERTNEDHLMSHFSQFGHIESYTFFQKTSQRNTAAALITYGLSVDINYIIQQNQRISFDGHNLLLRRTLPMHRPAYERFMTSNALLISLANLPNDKEFNEITIRKYLSKYGSIVSCRTVIRCTTFLIDFVDTTSVDWAILDEPHFYNEKELILRKYVTPDRLRLFRTKKILFDQNKFSFLEKIRRLEHITEALKFGQRIELKLIKSSCEEKIIRQLNKMCDDMNGKNNSCKLIIERNQQIRKDIIDLYKNKIENEQNRAQELKTAIDLLM
jgi:RNA recognition motif-containing protein